MSVGSLHARPKNDSPTGNPCTSPAGTVMFGYPATAAYPELLPPEMVTVDQVGHPGRSTGRSDNGVQLVLIHGPVDAIGTGQTPSRGQRCQIRRVRERSLRLCREQSFLAEVGHLVGRVALVEGDETRQ